MSEGYREYAEIVRRVWPDWEVAEKIGSGAFATVVRVSRRDGIAGEKDSAVKIIRIPHSDSDWDLMLAEGKSEEQAERYFQDVVDDSLREIRAMEDLCGNTNIVNIFDYKVHRIPEKHAWYILIRMEYLQKVSTAAFSEEETIRLGADVCTALSICRKKNIVHRDVSLDNVFIHDGNYKLGDFGVAKVLEGTIGTMHSIAGKPLYMAPEVYNATLEDTDIDSAVKVDIYSLGILLYRLCNNMKYPFEDPDKETTTSKERNDAFRRRVIEGESIPAPRNASPELAAVILKACMANPGKRYESADAMKADLEALARERQPEKPRRALKRAIAALGVLAALAAAYVFLLRPALFPEWSAWSEWTTERRAETDAAQTQEESKERYVWTALQCASCGRNNPADRQECLQCGAALAGAQAVHAYSDDTVSEVIDGKELGRYFGGSPYWFSGRTMQYRYRARKQQGLPETNGQPAAEDFCHDWYLSTYEDAKDYPGVVFLANGGNQSFSVYAGGDGRLIMVDNSYSSPINQNAALEEGVLVVNGYTKYTLEDGRLVTCSGDVKKVYTREPPENQIPGDVSSNYGEALRPGHYEGTWEIVKYGLYDAFTDAEAMGIRGQAVIKDRKMTVTWTRDGKEKSFEITFDEELNRGRLYTVVDGELSYIVSLRANHTILLQVGMNQVEWVFRKTGLIDEETVHPDVPGFEEAFAQRDDWTDTEEGRNALAQLLIDAAVTGGVDPSWIRADGAFTLALIGKDPKNPVLYCDGTGGGEGCMLTVGRGTKWDTKEPFVYYKWEDEFYELIGNPGGSPSAYQAENILPIVCGDCIWPVRVSIP